MLDIKFVRDNQEAVAEAMKNRHASWDASRFSELDETRRAAIAKEEALQAERNATSKSIGQMMAAGQKDEAEAAKQRVRAINDELAVVGKDREAADEALREVLLRTPNVPADSTPVGDDEDDNPEVRRWGTPRNFAAEGFEMKPHWDLGPELGIIDFERAVKLAASRFILLGGLGARLERALINFMADTHASRGYKEWWCPAMANAETLTGTGQLPKFEEDLFHTTEGLYLIPTAEVQLTNIHAGEVLDAGQLPLKYCAFTPCFREEAGSAGRDTRGLIRVHQFDKVEMFVYCKPEVRRPGGHGGRRREHPAAAGPAVPRDQPVHGRHRVLRRQDVRPRGVAAVVQRLQRDLLVLELHGLPGASREHQVPRPRELQGLALRPHAERLRPGGRSHHGRRHRELPAARRHRARARRAGALHGRRRGHRAGITAGEAIEKNQGTLKRGNEA